MTLLHLLSSSIFHQGHRYNLVSHLHHQGIFRKVLSPELQVDRPIKYIPALNSDIAIPYTYENFMYKAH